MILGAFGDSFLHGSDLSDCPDEYWPGKGRPHSQLTWPALIAKSLNLQYRCYADPGIGNARIAQTVLEAVHNYSNQCVYIINWTWIERFDFYNLQGSDGGQGWDTTLPSQSNEYSKQYYKIFHSELNDKITSLGSIYQALMALQTHGCKFIMTYMDDLMLDTKYHCPDNVQFLQNQIQPFLTNFDNNNFLEWSKANGFPISKGWHPLEQAHQKAAEYWINDVSRMLNTRHKEE